MKAIRSNYEIVSSWEEASRETSSYDSNLLISDLPMAKHDPLDNCSTAFNLSNSELQTVCMMGLCIAKLCKPIVRVLDVGGGGGEHFVNVKKIIGSDVHLDWTVLETKTFAEYGSNYINCFGLKFTHNRNILNDSYDIVLTSGTLMYLEDALELMTSKPVSLSEYIVINRTALIEDGVNHYTRNTVYYDEGSISYPTQTFSANRFVDALTIKYSILTHWPNVGETSVSFGNKSSFMYGFLLKRKQEYTHWRSGE